MVAKEGPWEFGSEPLGEEGRGGGREGEAGGGGKGKAQECCWEGEQGGGLFLNILRTHLLS